MDKKKHLTKLSELYKAAADLKEMCRKALAEFKDNSLSITVTEGSVSTGMFSSLIMSDSNSIVYYDFFHEKPKEGIAKLLFDVTKLINPITFTQENRPLKLYCPYCLDKIKAINESGKISALFLEGMAKLVPFIECDSIEDSPDIDDFMDHMQELVDEFENNLSKDNIGVTDNS